MVADPGLTVEQLSLAFFLSAVNMGIFCGFDARRVGRSFLIWFAIGFLLAPFGLLIWLFMRDVGEKQAERRRAAAAGPDAGGPPGAASPAEPGLERPPASSGSHDALTEGGAAPATQRAAGPASGERRYQLLTQLSKAAARNPGVDFGDLVDRARHVRTPAEFEAVERDIRERAGERTPPAPAAPSGEPPSE